MKNILEIDSLSKTYHTINGEIPAIKNITLNLGNQEFIAIVGSSGCGKSTLLSILAGLDKDYEGNIKKTKKNIGYMLQTDSLLPWLSILDNCLLGLKIKKNLTPQKIIEAERLLKKYNLIEFKDKLPSSLSGGMRQRVE